MATDSPSSDTPTPTVSAPPPAAAASTAVTSPSPTSNTKSNTDNPPEPPDSSPLPATAADAGSRGSTPAPAPADSSSSSPQPQPPPAATEPTTSASTEEAPKSSSPKPLTISIPVATSPAFFSYAGAGDSRTFSQLLAGAMASSPVVASSPLANRPGTPVLAVPMVAVPCFLAPAGLLDSCGITGQFAMSHQAVLATVTAQAQMQLHAGFSSPTHQNQFPLSPMPLQQKSPQKSEVIPTSPDTASAKQLQGVDVVVKSVSNDGYNWRKYGQKQVKSSDSSRSYYRCTQVNCSAKKKVQRSSDGRVTEVVYHGDHNHEPSQKGKYTKEREIQTIGVRRESQKSETLDTNSNQVETSSKAEKKSMDMIPEQLHCSSDCEDDTASKIEDHDEPDPKRRLSENPMTPVTPLFRTVREQKVIIEKGCNGGLPSDGFRWRKYGQKIVKGNPNPRSYYKCTHLGCPVRKHVERNFEDAKMVVITYEGNHIHDSPFFRVGSESPATPVQLGVSASAASEEKKLECDSTLDQKPPASEGKKFEGDSALDKKPPLDCQSKIDAELPDEKPNTIEEATVKESEEQKAMEINLSTGVGSVEVPDFINQPIFDESKAAVAVKNA